PSASHLHSFPTRRSSDLKRMGIAQRLTFEPMVVELDAQHVEAVEAERVDVAVSDSRPVAKLDAELVRRMGRTDEIRLVEAQQCRSEEHTSELQSRGHLVC